MSKATFEKRLTKSGELKSNGFITKYLLLHVPVRIIRQLGLDSGMKIKVTIEVTE